MFASNIWVAPDATATFASRMYGFDAPMAVWISPSVGATGEAAGVPTTSNSFATLLESAFAVADKSMYKTIASILGFPDELAYIVTVSSASLLTG